MIQTRRDFLKTSGVVLGGATLPSWILDQEAAVAAAVDKSGLADIAISTAK